MHNTTIPDLISRRMNYLSYRRLMNVIGGFNDEFVPVSPQEVFTRSNFSKNIAECLIAQNPAMQNPQQIGAKLALKLDAAS